MIVWVWKKGLNLNSNLINKLYSFQVNRLTKCDICVTLKEEKQKTMDKNSRNYYDMLYNQHNELQRYIILTQF